MSLVLRQVLVPFLLVQGWAAVLTPIAKNALLVKTHEPLEKSVSRSCTAQCYQVSVSEYEHPNFDLETISELLVVAFTSSLGESFHMHGNLLHSLA